MKIYKRKDIIELEPQDENESDQLNFLFYLISSNSVNWNIYTRDGKNILSVALAKEGKK